VDWQPLDLLQEGEGAGGLLSGVDTVVHLAAHAHISGVQRYWSNPFQRANADATERLAQQALRAGVRRFIFLSTVGVHGSESRMGQGTPMRIRETDPLRPSSAYARSKLGGEQALARVCRGGAMEWVTLRAPLVFGPGNGGNFLRLLRHLDWGLPLPVGSRPAPRSLAYVENLADLIVNCIRRPEVANRAFLIADFDLTVAELAARLAALLGRPLRTLRLPDWLLHGSALRSLTRPLLVDAGAIRAASGWQPAVALDAALAQTVAWYRSAP
jgi:nucleoside-diphosphate-sugar epimerase